LDRRKRTKEESPRFDVPREHREPGDGCKHARDEILRGLLWDVRRSAVRNPEVIETDSTVSQQPRRAPDKPGTGDSDRHPRCGRCPPRWRQSPVSVTTDRSVEIAS